MPSTSWRFCLVLRRNACLLYMALGPLHGIGTSNEGYWSVQASQLRMWGFVGEIVAFPGFIGWPRRDVSSHYIPLPSCAGHHYPIFMCIWSGCDWHACGARSIGQAWDLSAPNCLSSHDCCAKLLLQAVGIWYRDLASSWSRASGVSGMDWYRWMGEVMVSRV